VATPALLEMASGRERPILGITASLDSSCRNLPSASQAFLFARDCLGLNSVASGKLTDPTGKRRQELRRFRTKTNSGQTSRVHQKMESQFYSVFRQYRIGDFGHGYAVMDEPALAMLAIYCDILPKLRNVNRPAIEVLWALAEHVFVPTLVCIWSRHWRAGIGQEFAGEASWYLPTEHEGEIEKPFTRIFRFWMRTVGCGSINQLAQRLRESGNCSKGELQDSLRQKLGRWLKDSGPVSLHELFGFVDAMKTEAQWLGEPGDWKARFALALAIQRLMDAVDDILSTDEKDPSRKLAAWFRATAREGVIVDDSGILAQPKTHFAVRLIQRRLMKTKQWEKIVRTPKQYRQMRFAKTKTEEEIRARIAVAEYNAKPGNRFAAWMLRNAANSSRLASAPNSLESYMAVQDFIFDTGVAELQHLMRRKNKRSAN